MALCCTSDRFKPCLFPNSSYSLFLSFPYCPDLHLHGPLHTPFPSLNSGICWTRNTGLSDVPMALLHASQVSLGCLLVGEDLPEHAEEVTQPPTSRWSPWASLAFLRAIWYRTFTYYFCPIRLPHLEETSGKQDLCPLGPKHKLSKEKGKKGGHWHT